MDPRIDGTRFGSITIEGETFGRDVLIRLSGEVTKRKKKLSKAVYGTSHVVSLEEAEYVFQEGAELLIVGTGQSGLVELSEAVADYFRNNGYRVELLPTRQAIETWNQAEGAVIGLFHVTC
jgi:hypothetical protein